MKMETTNLITKTLSQIGWLLILTIIVILIGTFINMLKEKSMMKRRLKVFLAVELLMKSKCMDDKNHFCEKNIYEINDQLCKIANENKTNKSIREAIEKTDMKYLTLYYDIVIHDKLCNKKIKETRETLKKLS
jgi:hypothetical protein